MGQTLRKGLIEWVCPQWGCSPRGLTVELLGMGVRATGAGQAVSVWSLQWAGGSSQNVNSFYGSSRFQHEWGRERGRGSVPCRVDLQSHSVTSVLCGPLSHWSQQRCKRRKQEATPACPWEEGQSVRPFLKLPRLKLLKRSSSERILLAAFWSLSCRCHTFRWHKDL